jgi:hypothetical protein
VFEVKKMENDWISDLLKLMVSKKILSVLVMTIVVGSLITLVMSKAVKAEDEKEYEKEDSEHEYEKEGSWDLSEDFKPETPAVPKTETPKVETVAVKKTIKKQNSNNPIETVKLNISIKEPENITLPEFNETLYLDDDNDTIINKNDQYPGENDLLYIDSDNDTIVDAYDRYSGKNDLDFEDRDNDGVIDSKDSNPGKNTDKNHNGIDDAYEKAENKNFVRMLLQLLGLMKE